MLIVEKAALGSATATASLPRSALLQPRGQITRVGGRTGRQAGEHTRIQSSGDGGGGGGGLRRHAHHAHTTVTTHTHTHTHTRTHNTTAQISPARPPARPPARSRQPRDRDWSCVIAKPARWVAWLRRRRASSPDQGPAHAALRRGRVVPGSANFRTDGMGWDGLGCSRRTARTAPPVARSRFSPVLPQPCSRRRMCACTIAAGSEGRETASLDLHPDRD